MKRHNPSDALRRAFLVDCAGSLPNQVDATLCGPLAPYLHSVLELERGETLAHAGSELASIYLSGSGAFKSVMLGEDGAQQVVYFYWPGELIELSGFAVRRYLTEVVAVAPSRVYEFTLSRIERLGQQDPSVLESLLSHVSDRLAEAEKSQFMLGSLSAVQRMAFLLSDTLQRREHAPRAPRLSMPMSRGDLASYLGIAPETVSRLLGWLQQQQVIRMLPGRVVEVLDEARIRAWLLGGTPERSPLSRMPST
jgi:CRP/FNR family transcriptional regulator